MSEDNVKKCLREWLQREGWNINVAQPHGVDVEATKEVHHWFIEAKGDGESNNQHVNFMTGLGQIITRMTEAKFDYSIAMPDTEKWHRLWEKVPQRVAQLLGLSAVFVDEQGNINIDRRG